MRSHSTGRRVAGVALLAMVLPGCSGLASRLLLHPSHDPRWCPGERVVLAADGDLEGLEVEAFRARSGEGEPEVVVLALTGNAGRAEDMVGWAHSLWSQAMGPRAVEIVSVQYPGYGRSSGGAELRLLGPAALAGYRLAREIAGERRVIVHGLSMGSTAAMHLARVLPASENVGFVFERPPNLWSQVIWQHGWWNLWLLALPVAWGLPASVCSDDNAAAAAGHPALFLIARFDRTVPPDYSREVADAYAGPMRVLDVDAGHGGFIDTGNCPGLGEGYRWLVGWTSDAP